MNSVTRRLGVVLAVLTVGTAVAACGSDTASSSSAGGGAQASGAGGAAQSGDVTVDIKNFAFAPPTLTVKVGTNVTWTNSDSAKHTATADDQSFDTGNIDGNAKAKVITLSKAGTIKYHCNIHQYMTATITVTQ